MKLTNGTVRPHNAIFQVYGIAPQTLCKNNSDAFLILRVNRMNPVSGIFVQDLSGPSVNFVVSRTDIRNSQGFEGHHEKDLGNVFSQLAQLFFGASEFRGILPHFLEALLIFVRYRGLRCQTNHDFFILRVESIRAQLVGQVQTP